MVDVERGLGYREDPSHVPYERFGAVHQASLVNTYPDVNLELIKHAPPPSYQDLLEGCVGWAIAIASYAKQSAEGLEAVFPSPGFIWWNSRKQHGDETVNTGTYPHLAVASLNDIGMCAEKYWTVEQTKFHFDQKPSRLAFTHAFDHKFEVRTQKLYGSGEDLRQQIKAAFAVQGPITFGLQVSKSFVEMGKHTVINEPEPDEPIAGGHYMAALGYDELGLLGPQTWRYWGNEGWFRIGWDYILRRATDIVTYKFVPRLG